MKKYIFAVLAVFGLNALAEMGMADEDAGGFSGSVELKYRHDVKGGGVGDLSYRARAGWTGNVNDLIQWGLGFSSDIEAAFNTYHLGGVHLEQAYVNYSPVKQFALKVGKYERYSGFHKYGVLVDDDLYSEGVKVKFHHEVSPAVGVYVKAAVESVGEEYAGIWGANHKTAKGWAGVHSEVNDWKLGVGVGAETNKIPSGSDSAITLFQGKVSVGSGALGMPAGVFGFASSNADNLTDVKGATYTVGAHVGDTSETHGYSVGVSYYNVAGTSWNTAVVDTDYLWKQEATVADSTVTDAGETAGEAVADATGSGVATKKGVAAKVQYNLFDNADVVAKYNYTFDGDHGVVGELTFKF